MTNIRSRNDTFRQFRERFETLRSKPGFSDALNTAPPGVTKGKAAKDELNHDPRKVVAAMGEASGSADRDAIRKEVRASVLIEAEEVLKPLLSPAAHAQLDTGFQTLRSDSTDGEAWKTTIEIQESYWVRTFDEWYVTTGGQRVWPNPAWPISIPVKRLLGVYRVIWDEYYREAISNTVQDNPMMMVALWHAYRRGHADMDLRFLKDMWDITDKDSRQAVEGACDKWNELKAKH